MRYFLWILAGALIAPLLHGTDREEAFLKASKTLVHLEFFVQREIDRDPGETVGLVVSDDGLIVCLPDAFPQWTPPENIRSIEAFPANNPIDQGLKVEYLGQDWVNDWHYLRIEDWKTAQEHLTPITSFQWGRPRIGDTVWGVSIMNEASNYLSIYLEGKLSATKEMPLDTAVATDEVASPGGPVFLEDGSFCGWALVPNLQPREFWIGSEFFPAFVRLPGESHMFLLAEPFLQELGKRIPETPTASRRPWIGVTGAQPLEKETSRFMGLTDKGVVIVSEVLPDTPAARAGLQDRDLITALNGVDLPPLKPDSLLQLFFERELLLCQIGEPIQLTILRDDQEIVLEITPEKAPKSLKDSPRHYIGNLGLSVRDFLVSDAIQRRHDHRDLHGVLVSFVRPNSPAASAELAPGDWILEIGGNSVQSYEEAVELLENAAADDATTEVVVLIRRSGETSVLRIRKA